MLSGRHGELNRLTLSERVALRGCQRLHPGAQSVPVPLAA